MQGVNSFLKRSHSGVTPVKMAKESTPGDSDSWNRCNPNGKLAIADSQVKSLRRRREKIEALQLYNLLRQRQKVSP